MIIYYIDFLEKPGKRRKPFRSEGILRYTGTICMWRQNQHGNRAFTVVAGSPVSAFVVNTTIAYKININLDKSLKQYKISYINLYYIK